VNINRLWLTDFRNYESAEIAFVPGALTAIVGANGEGKSNLIEALTVVTTRKSFRGAANEAMIRVGADAAILRSDGQQEDGRELLVEMEIPPSGRVRMQLNKQNISRIRDLVDLFAVVVFSPDDLVLIKGGPGERRDWLDDLLGFKGAKYAAITDDFEHILKQRNALLRDHEGYLTKAQTQTLDVLDEQISTAGDELVAQRNVVLDEISPHVAKAYKALAEHNGELSMNYQQSWNGTLLDALKTARDSDVRRRTSTVGPHRDDISLLLNNMSSRTHASQGEQRSLVLALRLASQQWLSEIRREAPLLLLDDVFSELDEHRRNALIDNLPTAQTILTTASDVPSAMHPAAIMRIENGKILS
jgi:DNA replication and repair protein RecF